MILCALEEKKSLSQHLTWRTCWTPNFLSTVRQCTPFLLPPDPSLAVCVTQRYLNQVPQCQTMQLSPGVGKYSNCYFSPAPPFFFGPFSCLYIKIFKEEKILLCRVLTFPVFNNTNLSLFNTLLYSKGLTRDILFNLYNKLYAVGAFIVPSYRPRGAK